jgi:hypothetical protein
MSTMIDQILSGTGNTLICIRSEDVIPFASTCANLIIAGQAAGQTKLPVKQEPEKPISQAEAVIYLGKSRQTLIKWRKKGIIQAYRLGGRIYYLPSQLLLALKNG